MKKKILSFILSIAIWLCNSLKDDGKITANELSELRETIKKFYDKANQE